MDSRWSSASTSLGLLILRIGVGGFMMTHGLGKLKMLLDGKGAEFVDPIGVGKEASLVLVTAAELLAAALVVIGLGTRIAALMAAFAMFVAAFIVHAADPWSMEVAVKRFFAGESQTFAAKEVALLYLVPFLTLALTGPGKFSLDHLIRKSRRRKPDLRDVGAVP